MRQIMHYDGEFRREEATPQSALTRSPDGGSGSTEHGVQFDPTPMLDRPGGHWACKSKSPAAA